MANSNSNPTMSLDQLFSSTVLNLLIPDTSLPFPPDTSTAGSADAWLTRAQTNAVERRQAFFDEQLLSLLVLRIKNPLTDNDNNDSTARGDPDNPPEILLDLLSHIQVSLEASYISPIPTSNTDGLSTPRTATATTRLLATPKTTSHLGRPPNPSGRLKHQHHPSILPPSTPNPTPATGDGDRKYTSSEGTVLVASIWGNNNHNGNVNHANANSTSTSNVNINSKEDNSNSNDSRESFLLLWSDEDKGWVAVYRMAITVSFLRLAFNNPLLCLTVSATLREKPIQTHPNHPLTRFLASIGEKRRGLGSPTSPSALSSSSSPSPVEGGNKDGEDVKLLDGLEEVNLLDGLLAGPTFGKSNTPELNLPSLRLGTVSRQKLFSLPPILVETPSQPSPSPMTAVRKAHPTLRKSYRKTLQTVSGFRVRMRTVFVPYVLLPETEGMIQELDEEKKERERREAGSEEKTVVLCVEIENSGDMGMGGGGGGGGGPGFMVERVEVTIGGEGAKATLIGWGDHAFTPDAARHTFPLRIGPLAQFNLLYAVTFMRSPEEIDGFSFAQSANNNNGISPELQRAVTINIFGKPYFPPPPSSSSSSRQLVVPDINTLSYPTHTFSSRWNCVLDLAAQQQPQVQPTEIYDSNDPAHGRSYPSVLPEPASPFPAYAMYGGSAMTPGGGGGGGGANYPYSNGSTPQYSAYTAGSRRFTLVPGANFAGRTLKTLTPNRAAAATRTFDTKNDQTSPQGSSRLSSLVQEARYIQSPTTYSAPPPPPLSGHQHPHLPPPLSLGPSSDDGHGTIAQGQYSSYTGGPGGGGGQDTPVTPAYPAYPSKSNLPPTPMSQGPVLASSGHGVGAGGNVGLSVEIRRERGIPDYNGGAGAGGGAGGAGMPIPQTPLPVVSGAFGEQKMLAKLHGAGASGENVVVSVGLMPVPRSRPTSGPTSGPGPGSEIHKVDGDDNEDEDEEDDDEDSSSASASSKADTQKKKEPPPTHTHTHDLGPGKIYPLDIFTLDIFVFNQSLWPRRFEVTCPDRRRRRRGGRESGVYDGGSEAARKMGYPGVLPLDSRIRIGPLRPSACQSVRMDFLAVSPGVHSIDTLTLTDVETGFSTNLRSVLDVVVHEPCA